jgi:hypothetical protein
MRYLNALFILATLSACEIRPLTSPGSNHGSATYYDSNWDPSGPQSNRGHPYVIDAYTECYLDDYGDYRWFSEALVDHSSGYLDQIHYVQIEIYDPQGLAETYNLGASYSDPGWYEYTFIEGQAYFENLFCGSNIPYEVYTTVADLNGTFQTVVNYL